MKKFFDTAVGIISTITGIAGLILVVIAIFGDTKGGEGTIFFLGGMGCIASCVVLIGFSFVVDAACLYLENNKKKAEE